MAQEIKLTLTGYRADEVLPDGSGDYLVLKALPSGSRELWMLTYSAKYRVWNACDWMPEESANKYRIDSVMQWFYVPEEFAQKEGDAAHD